MLSSPFEALQFVLQIVVRFFASTLGFSAGGFGPPGDLMENKNGYGYGLGHGMWGYKGGRGDAGIVRGEVVGMDGDEFL